MKLPKSYVEGLVPTLNNTGWMTESLDAVSTAFAEYAGQADGEALDIGCAYGVATLKALACGARVLACDIEPRHLEILQQQVPEVARDRVRTQAATLPDADFPAESFAAILASRVLHFLSGEDVQKTVAKMHRWLVPGGRLFWVSDTPYAGPWKVKAGEFEQRKAAGDEWPGYFTNYEQFLRPGSVPEEHPRFINVADPDVLERVCRRAGFNVMEARWLRGGTPRAGDRDHAGVIAVRR